MTPDVFRVCVGAVPVAVSCLLSLLAFSLNKLSIPHYIGSCAFDAFLGDVSVQVN